MEPVDPVELMDRSMLRPWVIFEQGRRWTSAAFRFADILMPPTLVAAITTLPSGPSASVGRLSPIRNPSPVRTGSAVDASGSGASDSTPGAKLKSGAERRSIISKLSPPSLSHQPNLGLVIWEFTKQTSPEVVDDLFAIASTRKNILQLVATSHLSVEQQLVLTEIGVSGILRHPEDLWRFSRLIQGHFARSTTDLD
ncbi:hypothetical protein N9N28_14015 [Rubripirellula amarantea]|nr:hypothetical protein [Rubripirellula amarantea]